MNEHYYTEHPKSKLILHEYEITILNNPIKIISASGLFSKKKVDKGSRLLIENSIIKEDYSVLDLGCGNGIVGISIAKAYRLQQITFSDINSRAVEITRENCKNNNIKKYKIIQSNIFEKINLKFDTILLNPPQTAGKDTCFDILRQPSGYQ